MALAMGGAGRRRSGTADGGGRHGFPCDARRVLWHGDLQHSCVHGMVGHADWDVRAGMLRTVWLAWQSNLPALELSQQMPSDHLRWARAEGAVPPALEGGIAAGTRWAWARALTGQHCERVAQKRKPEHGENRRLVLLCRHVACRRRRDPEGCWSPHGVWEWRPRLARISCISIAYLTFRS